MSHYRNLMCFAFAFLYLYFPPETSLMPLLQLKNIYCFILASLPVSAAISQNLKGQKVVVGTEAPAFIIFNGEVKTAEFVPPDANKSYTIKLRGNNSLCITYKKELKLAPDNIGLTVQEGKRNHYFIINFKKGYDINRDPPLWYDYSDLKELKKYVKEQSTTNKDELARLEAEAKKKANEDEAERQRQIEETKKQQERDKAKKKLELDEAKKIDDAKQKELEKALAQAKADERKKADEQKKAEAIAKQQEKDRKKADILAKAKLDEENRKKEHDDALVRLKKLEDEKKAREEAEKYSRVGLWKRYGSKGINIFDLPEKQVNLVNADFFLVKDTVKNFTICQQLLNEKTAPLNIRSEKSSNGVSLVLESITFNGPNAYFKILISNKSSDDFLMGLTGIFWYNADGSQKMWLSCSYITYIQSFPILPPGQETRIVLVTRDANVSDNELLNINISERRPEKEKLDIILNGKVFNKEKMKIEKKL